MGRPYGFQELGISPLPTSRDFAEGSWTRRLADAGEWSATFPNRQASNGVPWRERFSADGHLQWVEIYRDDILESVGVITKIAPDQQKVTISGQDGWFCLRKAYERDFQCLMAPRDVLERYSHVWSMVTGTKFSLSKAQYEGYLKIKTPTNWSFFTLAGHTATITTGEPTGAVLTISSFPNDFAEIVGPQIPAPGHLPWEWTVAFTVTEIHAGLFEPTKEPQPSLTFRDVRSGYEAWILLAANAEPNPGTAFAFLPKAGLSHACAAYSITGMGGGPKWSIGPYARTLPFGLQPGPHTMTMSSDGRFRRAWIDGYLLGSVPETESGCHPAMSLAGQGATAQIVVTEWYARVHQPFLMGANKGQYVLPGTIHTYPWGGLTGRYYNDLQWSNRKEAGTAEYQRMCFAPEVSQNTNWQYKDRTDAELNSSVEPLLPPSPGVSAENEYWSCRWFGSIYLKLASAGTHKLIVEVGEQCGVRVFLGKTGVPPGAIESYIETSIGTARTVTSEFSNNFYEAEPKDGWYPIIIEFFHGTGKVEGTGVKKSITLKFEAPATYTDPGGKTITTKTITIVPSTSLSPLGCVDQRFQGTSHYTILKEIGESFGYQLTVEPRQFESGEFPGVIIPMARAGRNTDEIIESDSILARSPITAFGSVADATDQATSLHGSGSGLPNGQSSQIAVEEFAINRLSTAQLTIEQPGFAADETPNYESALFDLQAWVDSSGTNSPTLLGNIAASQLALQEAPWQNVEGEPLARDRLSYGFPLRGPLAAFHWHPGDGVRLWLPEINVTDTEPRQLLQVTRNFGPIGRHSTQVGFRQRPLDRTQQVNRLLAKGAQNGRSYQGAAVTVPTNPILESIIGGGNSNPIVVALAPSDIVISAQLLIYTNQETATPFKPVPLTVQMVKAGVWTNITSMLGGGENYSRVPLVIDLRTILPVEPGPIQVGVKNGGTVTATIGMTAHFVVLR
jgi:hypothetical protein